MSGTPGTSGAVNGTGDYLHYFRDRYNRLGGMIRGRAGSMPIEALTKNSRYRQEDCTVVGMVNDVSTTKNGHRIAEIEDTSGSITVLFRKDRPAFADAEKIIHDEVIGVKGKLSSDGKLFFAEILYRPDIRIDNAPYRSEKPGKAVFISDVHVGSDTFLEESWNRFSDWLSDNDFSYLLIAGDLVDGIGIYPGQDAELTIKNIYEQYDAFGEMLSRLPSRMQIIISPGTPDVAGAPSPSRPCPISHEVPRQLVLVETRRSSGSRGPGFYVPWPVHRRHDRAHPGSIVDKSGQMMDEMLVRRHLAPAYGRRTPIAAGKADRLIIDPLPEILHTGHVHIKGITTYRGVLGINAGTWQSQTKFQKQMNGNPTPALAGVVDLQTLVPATFSFA
jgi:DNA polymerase II small subunit